jgi:glc operon protein GlcG
LRALAAARIFYVPRSGCTSRATLFCVDREPAAIVRFDVQKPTCIEPNLHRTDVRRQTNPHGGDMIKHRLLGLALTALLAALSFNAAAQLTDKKALTLDAAKKIATAAEAEAQKNKWNVVIAVVDDGGHLIYLQRMDTTQTGSIEVAIRKAQTAMSFKRPTKVFEDAVAGGRNVLIALPGALPLEGGLPISSGGQIIGAIGVSGVTAQQDGQIAKAGADSAGDLK